jgi:hypothetical protein
VSDTGTEMSESESDRCGGLSESKREHSDDMGEWEMHIGCAGRDRWVDESIIMRGTRVKATAWVPSLVSTSALISSHVNSSYLMCLYPSHVSYFILCHPISLSLISLSLSSHSLSPGAHTSPQRPWAPGCY